MRRSGRGGSIVHGLKLIITSPIVLVQRVCTGLMTMCRAR